MLPAASSGPRAWQLILPPNDMASINEQLVMIAEQRLAT
jgi:hypothetical protein